MTARAAWLTRQGGAADSPGAAGAGAPGAAGSPAVGDGGASNTNTPTAGAGALPTTTFLYVQSLTPDADQLVSLDYLTGETRVVTDLQGDGSDGWEIWGHAIDLTADTPVDSPITNDGISCKPGF